MTKTISLHLNEVESENARKFMSECSGMNSDRGGMIGGRFSYTVTPTSLANTVVIQDSITGREENITDFNSW